MRIEDEDVLEEGTRVRVYVDGLRGGEASVGLAAFEASLRSQAVALPNADGSQTYSTGSVVQEFVVLVGSGLTTAGIAALVKQAFSRSERRVDITIEADMPGRVEVHVRDRRSV